MRPSCRYEPAPDAGIVTGRPDAPAVREPGPKVECGALSGGGVGYPATADLGVGRLNALEDQDELLVRQMLLEPVPRSKPTMPVVLQ